MTDRELMQQALDALAQSWVNDHHGNRKQVLAMCADDFEKPFRAMLALRRRLSQCERCGKASPAEIHTCTPDYVDRRQWRYDPMTGKPLCSKLCAICAQNISQPEQEPVAWMGAHDRTDLYCRKPPQADVIPLYTAPPQREWQGLTHEEHMNEDKIRIKRYEQAADEKVSIGGIKWLKKWDVCIQCDSRDEAERVREWVCKAESRAQNDFNPDWDAMTVMVEEQQRMAKHIEELKAQLAQPKQEPVAWMYVNEDGECEQIEYGEPFDDPSVTPLYAAPPRESSCAECGKKASEGWALYCVECSAPMREWVGLTADDTYKIGERLGLVDVAWVDLMRAIEAALKAKNA